MLKLDGRCVTSYSIHSPIRDGLIKSNLIQNRESTNKHECLKFLICSCSQLSNNFHSLYERGRGGRSLSYNSIHNLFYEQHLCFIATSTPFLNLLSNAIPKEKDDVILQCVIPNDLEVNNIELLKDGYLIESNVNGGNLFILKNVSVQSSGSYQCRSGNKQSSQIVIQVSRKHSTITFFS